MKRQVRRLTCLAMVLVLLAGLCPTAWASSKKAVVSDSSAKFYKSASSHSDHLRIEKGATVEVKDVSGDWAKVKYKGVTGYMRTEDLSAKGSSSSGKSKGDSWKSQVKMLKWFEGGKSFLHEGSYGMLYDVKTGKQIKIKRMGGYNHADCEPATKSDAKKLKSLGSSWDPRPGILRVGDKFTACSFNTYEHGDQTIKNNGYNGQFCLHMIGSKTHGGDQVRSDHQSAIKRAYNWAH